MNYLFEYDTPEAVNESVSAFRPRWVKSVVDSDGVEQRIILDFANTQEREFLTTEQVYVHLDNLVLYIKDVSQLITPIRLDDSVPTDGWHLNGGWGEIEWAKEETLRWWESVYYKDEEAEEEIA